MRTLFATPWLTREVGPELNIAVVLDVGAARSADPMPSPWVWRTYTKAEIAEMQQNDPDIKEILAAKLRRNSY